MYLAIFYTLVLKVNPVHVGILMLITKLWDAINDPLIGALVDSHQNKGKGKFLPWIKFFAFPTAVLCILGFVNVSNFAYGARLAYMFITYVVYEIMYTCVSVPFGSLSSVMTCLLYTYTAAAYAICVILPSSRIWPRIRSRRSTA